MRLAIAAAIATTPFRSAQAALTPTLARSPTELTAANAVASGIESLASSSDRRSQASSSQSRTPESSSVLTARSCWWSRRCSCSSSRVEQARSDHVGRSRQATIVSEAFAGFRAIGSNCVAARDDAPAHRADAGGRDRPGADRRDRDRAARPRHGRRGLPQLRDRGRVPSSEPCSRCRSRGRVDSARRSCSASCSGASRSSSSALAERRPRAAPLRRHRARELRSSTSRGSTLVQRAVPDDVLARVFGVIQMLWLGSIGIGAAIAPLLTDWLGVEDALS